MTPTMTELTMSGWQSSCFTSLLAFAFALYYSLCPQPCSTLIDTQPASEYDFIIVGAGAGGSVVANRLTECQNWKVLLLEAGGPPPNITDVPLMYSSLWNQEFDWNYRTEPPKNGQSYCLAQTDHRCPYPRGKVVGGTSATNAMIYTRANRQDYDDWEAMGNVGWGFNSVFKYFLKSEDNTNPCYLQTPYHSSGGYLTVEDIRYAPPIVYAFIKAGEYLGYKNRDTNGKYQEGIQLVQSMTRKGTRWSTAKAFVQTVIHRANFDLSMYSLVTKIGIEAGPSGPIARTVTYTKDNKQYTVRAKKEIIVSGGAINSPQLLMLSGIGPEEHLKDLGIKVWKNLPVGYNLHEHVGPIPVTFKVNKNVTVVPDIVENPDALTEYFEEGRGPLTTTLSEVKAFFPSKYNNQSRTRPELYFEFMIGSPFNGGVSAVTSMYNFRPNVFDGSEYAKLDKDANYFSIFNYNVRTKSTGRLTLRSKNPYDQPIIDPNFFAVREDLEALIDGFHIMLKLVESPPLKEFGAAPIRAPYPGCEHFELFSDQYFECHIRHYTTPAMHIGSTCAMGTVVDPRLRVKGIQGLRVIDTSVMPFVPAGNPQAPVMMIAEKGSDMIKEDWNVLNKCAEQKSRCTEDQRCSRPSTEGPFQCNVD